MIPKLEMLSYLTVRNELSLGHELSAVALMFLKLIFVVRTGSSVTLAAQPNQRGRL